MKTNASSETQHPGRPSIGFVIVLAILAAAPTVGDVGGCSTNADPLSPAKYFEERLKLENDRCLECGILTSLECKRAADFVAGKAVAPSTFPNGCQPVVHDGDVCLNALEAMSCSDFEDVVAAQPIVPTECDFCPAQPAGSTP